MFKKNTEVLTVLNGWVAIQKLKIGQLIWDGDKPVEVAGLHNYEMRRFCEIYNNGEYAITCGRHSRFILEDDQYSVEAASVNNPYDYQFIQEGDEKKPFLRSVHREGKIKLHTITLKNSNRFYVRADEVTGLLVKC